MAKTWAFKDRIPHPADKVLNVILDPNFNERWTVVQGGIDPKATMQEAGPNRKVMKLELTEKAGSFGTFRSTMTFDWDLNTKTMKWTRAAEGLGAKAKVSGVTKIIADGPTTCFFEETGSVEVGVPLLGRKIEDGVVHHQEKGRTAKVKYLIDEVAKR